MTQTTSQRILLAEDDTSTRSFLELMLQKSGYDVVACENGADAFSVLTDDDAKPFDLLLTDIVMPQMDGIELTQKALAHAPDLKVLYITGFSGTTPSSPASKNDENMSQVIPKPFHMNELLEKISKILQN